LVEVLEVLDVDLAEPSLSKIMEADLEPFVDVASDGSARVHVRLNRHQQHGIEALGLAVRGVGLNIRNPCAERHRPGGVDDKECGRAVGVGETPTGEVSSHKSTTQSSVWMVLDSWTGDQGAGGRRAVMIGSVSVY